MSTTTIIGRGPSSVDFPDAPTQQAESAPLGFAVYNDVATETTKINIQADVWTDMTNDGAGGTTTRSILADVGGYSVIKRIQSCDKKTSSYMLGGERPFAKAPLSWIHARVIMFFSWHTGLRFS